MIVIDSCAAAEMAMGSEIGQVLQGFYAQNEKAYSCSLVRAELASVFRKLTRTQNIEPNQASAYYSNALALVDEFVPLEEIELEAFAESIRLNHSTYDMFYFVLTRRLGATLFTTDKRLMKLCADNGVNCIQEIVFPAE